MREARAKPEESDIDSTKTYDIVMVLFRIPPFNLALQLRIGKLDGVSGRSG